MATSPSLATHVRGDIPSGMPPDHIYEDHPTYGMIVAQAKTQDGGLNYAPNRIYGKDGTSTWFAGTSLSAIISSASQTSKLLNETYNWTNLRTPITVLYDEDLRASGDPELVRISMEEAKREQARLDHEDTLANKMLQGDGSSQTPYGVLVALTPSSTLGGVDPSADTDWVPNTVTASTVYSGPSVWVDAIIPCLHKKNRPKWGPQAATIWAKTQNVFNMGILTQSKDSGVYKFGIKSLEVSGVEMYLDRDLPSNDGWLLDPDAIELRKHSRYWMKYKNPSEPTAGTDIHGSKIGYINSSFILAFPYRRSLGGYLALT
jgi:hypothetical protein